MFEIDIQSMVADLQLTRDELDQVRQLVVKAYVGEVYSETVELAIDRLASARGEYVGGLQIVKVDDYTYDLELKGSLPNMIESGCTSFDMKPFFQRSPKRIETKNGKGWYLTIPMLFKTPGANPRSDVPGQLLPRKIYDLIRNSPTSKYDNDEGEEISTLAGSAIPKRYQPGQLKDANRAADAYIPKSSIYAGLIRTKDKATGMSNYNTFRRASSNSDPKSWIHPGIPAFNLMDTAMSNVDQLDIAETALQKYFPTSRVRVSINTQLALEMNAKYNQMFEDMTAAILNQVKEVLQ